MQGAWNGESWREWPIRPRVGHQVGDRRAFRAAVHTSLPLPLAAAWQDWRADLWHIVKCHSVYIEVHQTSCCTAAVSEGGVALGCWWRPSAAHSALPAGLVRSSLPEQSNRRASSWRRPRLMLGKSVWGLQLLQKKALPPGRPLAAAAAAAEELSRVSCTWHRLAASNETQFPRRQTLDCINGRSACLSSRRWNAGTALVH